MNLKESGVRYRSKAAVSSSAAASSVSIQFSSHVPVFALSAQGSFLYGPDFEKPAPLEEFSWYAPGGRSLLCPSRVAFIDEACIATGSSHACYGSASTQKNRNVVYASAAFRAISYLNEVGVPVVLFSASACLSRAGKSKKTASGLGAGDSVELFDGFIESRRKQFERGAQVGAYFDAAFCCVHSVERTERKHAVGSDTLAGGCSCCTRKDGLAYVAMKMYNGVPENTVFFAGSACGLRAAGESAIPHVAVVAPAAKSRRKSEIDKCGDSLFGSEYAHIPCYSTLDSAVRAAFH